MAPKNQKKKNTSKFVAGAKPGAENRVKKPKKTALERLMAQSKESLQKRADEKLVEVQNLNAEIIVKKAKWAAERARDLAKLRRVYGEYKALKDQTAAALTAEGLASSLTATSEALKDEMAAGIKEEVVTIKEEDQD
ncbi:hypothetical protein B0T13DRAFT_514720 [Neurospora crassa]|nr:hypothetical protein B0T13DRAFT_514720 [Neurospora crassa]